MSGKPQGEPIHAVERLNWAEQLIEDVAEADLEHVHLGRCHRHALGPIVRQSPLRSLG
jgi:hypothetical protein